MKKFLNTFLNIIFSLIIFSALFYFFQNYQFQLVKEIQQKSINDQIKNIQEEISTPAPVLKINQEDNFILTNIGILKWTNFYRFQNNLKELNENNILDKIATLRAKDMFEKQYFAHYSNEGIGAPQIAKEVGYEYISIGENIALGNFKDDKELVDAWMNSPGHRKNILDSKYNEIGIALMKGDFYNQSQNKLQKVWIAVQVFGRPIGNCLKPDENLKNQIKDLENQLNNLKIQIENLKNELSLKIGILDRNNINSIKNYNDLVVFYNNLVNNYNYQLTIYKKLVAKYNLQVEMFNQCINL
ncbi:MAG: CAP domain-containing protein [Patescibacteria group bacterium]|nr:CAP domain-containing protein [Patescibacteria group bacterium]